MLQIRVPRGIMAPRLLVSRQDPEEAETSESKPESMDDSGPARIRPLIGARTWGGLIGISGAPGLVDGGVATVPTFRMYSTDSEWFEEGIGVAPDIPVAEDPGQLARGVDTQLERAIQETLRLIEQNPPTRAPRPAAERRVAGGGGR